MALLEQCIEKDVLMTTNLVLFSIGVMKVYMISEFEFENQKILPFYKTAAVLQYIRNNSGSYIFFLKTLFHSLKY